MAINLKEDSVFQQYLNSNYTYNDIIGNEEPLRQHWESFFQSFNQLSPKEIHSRKNAVLRLLKENGVTYNIYGDTGGLNRPWQLDLLPFLISQQEWGFIESGLVQRAKLLNLVLKDIYGERKLIRNGLLPMELIYRHPGFLRQCDKMQMPGKNSLILYSADMARATDGKIWVVSDRTQAPSGSGYALENRTSIARVLPELFNDVKVRRLSPYFNVLNKALLEIAPGGQSTPRVVILTPGPVNETYFEHAYLSSFLGFTLVEGNDLVVKNNFVWLKTLEGLEKVDVILRRVDDIYCDPLELKEDSQLGIPGLLQVVRSGNVSIANPLGSSILENPAIMPFLENICQYYFGEGLIMSNIASWWCGQPKELNYVLDNIDELVIKRIYREPGQNSSVDGSRLSAKELEALKLRIKANPQLFVGQEKVTISPTPLLLNDKIVPRNTLFRSFLVSNGESYTAMAGGLGRTSSEEGNFVISNQLGDISKDIWVVAPEPELPLNIQRSILDKEKRMSAAALPSHTAENLFWVGRYTERVLGNARFMRTVIQYLIEGNRLMAESDIETEHCLLKALTQYTYTSPGFVGENAKELFKNSWKELADILFNDKRINSLKYNYNVFANAVFSVRDHWSTDTWRLLRGMEEEWIKVKELPNQHLGMANPLDNLITSIVAFVGLNRESISREQGWIMLDAGRKMEQSLLLINMLQATLVNKEHEKVEYNLQESLLISNECLVNYRYKYRAPIQLSLVLDLMLFDPNNPRSLIYQLDRLKAYLKNLPKGSAGDYTPEYDKLISEVYGLLKFTDKEQLSVADIKKRKYIKLEELLAQLKSLLSGIYSEMSKVYFKHAQNQQQIFIAENI